MNAMDAARRLSQRLGLTTRLMVASALALLLSGGVLLSALTAADAASWREDLQARVRGEVEAIAPLIADQAVIGDYSVIQQLLAARARSAHVESIEWTDRRGAVVRSGDAPRTTVAPPWFGMRLGIDAPVAQHSLSVGGVGYGHLKLRMNAAPALDHLWQSFKTGAAILAAALGANMVLMFAVLRLGLRPLSALNDGTRRFGAGDYSVRVVPSGPPELRKTIGVFNRAAEMVEGQRRALELARDDVAHRTADLAQANGVLKAEMAERATLLEHLKRSEERFRMLTALSSDWFWEQDAELRFVQLTEGEHGAGISPQAHFGKTRWELPNTEIVSGDWEPHKAVLAARQPFRDLLLRRTLPDGARYVLVSGAPHYGVDGSFAGYRGVASDVTLERQAEEQLRASRAFLDRAGRLAGVGGWQLDIASEAIIWSDETCRIHGVPPGHVPRLDEAIAFYAPQVRPVIRQAVREGMANGTPWDLELPFVTATGRDIWVRAIGEVEYEDGRPVRLVGAFQDITQRRAMEDDLRRSVAVKRAILDSLPCGLSVFDDELNLRLHNGRLRSLLELPDHLFETPVTTMASLIEFNARRGEYGEGDVDAIVERALDRARAPGVHQFERQRPNGVALEIRGAPMPGGGFVTTYTDVSERKQIEAALKGTTAMLRSVLDAATEVAVIATGEDLRITVFNKGAEHMLGYAADEVMGRHTPAIFADADEATERARLLSVDLGRKIHGPGVVLTPELLGRAQEWTFVRKDGSRLPVSMVVTAMHTDGGEVSGFLGIAYDITRQQEHEQSLREALQRAEQASAAKGQFLANMSHEIRTPMNAILGMLTLLQKTPLTPRQLDYAGKTEGAARSLLGLLNDILDFSKVEAGKMELDPQPFATDRLMRDLSVILSANVGAKPVEVLFDVDPALPRELVGDGMRLQQVLINLAGNAIKFTAQGEVVVRLQVLERGGGNGDDVLLEIAVQDSGIGIAPEHRAHIFDGFSQAEASTTRRFGGTGLGLAICRRLVAMMGGELRVDSTPGVGSRFHFQLRLPMARGAGVPAEHGRGTEPLRALIVDDNASARDVMASMAQSLGWQADLASGGEQALAMVAARAPDAPYQAVFVDWQMPGLDGWETTQRLRQNAGRQAAPLIVMVTAHGREMLAQRSAQEQAALDGFLVKPVTASMLFDAVADARAASGQPHLSHAAAPPAAQHLAGLRVLLVEDNPNNRQVAQELLSDEGALVALANDGREGVQAVLGADPPFDVVLMDLQMPVLDGYSATAEIRQTIGAAQLPIIAMTANALAADREACLAAGMNDHVGKPFDLSSLVATLLRHTGRQGAASAPPAPAALPAELLRSAGLRGIELAAAIKRLGGNADVYLRLLRSFSTELQTLPARLAALLEQGQRGDAERLMHTVKGVAATLGVRALAAAAADAETRFARPDVARHDGRTSAEVGTAAGVALAALAALADGLQAALPGAAEAAAPAPLDSAALRRAVVELATLLAGSDMRALDLHAQLRQAHAAQLQQALQPLADAIAALDFDRAAAHCRSLIDSLAS